MLKKIVSLTILLNTLGVLLYAQPSMSIQNTLTIKNSVTKEEEAYTVFRDERNANQWYYEPRRFRFAEKTVQGQKPQPKVTIVKYQYYDQVTDGIKEGGAFMASLVMGARPTDEAALLSLLKKETKNPNARLSCINFKSAGNVNLLTNNPVYYQEGFNFQASKGSVSNQEMAIDLPLTVIGTDVIASAGVSVSGTLIYSAYLPPCGLEVKGSWDNIYSYYEKNIKAGGGLKLLGLQLGGTYDKGKISETMKSDLKMQITEYQCPGETAESTTRFDPIINEIKEAIFTKSALDGVNRMKELYEMLKDTANMSGAIVQKIKSAIREHEASLRAGVSIRSIQQQKKGSINFNYNKKTYTDRELSLGGYLSLNEYNFTPKELEKYVVEVKAGDWPKAIFGLPLGISADLGVSNMSITIKYTLPDGKTLQDSRQWRPEFAEGRVIGGKWVDPKNTTRESPLIQFALIGVDKKISMDQLDFDATLSITTNTSTLNVNKKIKAFNGTANFDAIEQLIDIIRVDATSVDFAKITSTPGDLDRVEISLTRDGKPVSKTIAPRNIMVPGSAPSITIPEPFAVIFPKNSTPIQINIRFRTSDNKIIMWSENGELQNSEIYLSNIDWKTFN